MRIREAAKAFGVAKSSRSNELLDIVAINHIKQ